MDTENKTQTASWLQTLKGDFRYHRNQYLIIGFVTLLLAFAFVFALIFQLVRCSGAASRIDRVTAQLENVERQLQEPPEKVGARFVTLSMQNLFSKDELAVFICSDIWSYALELDGKPLTSDTASITNDATLVLRETRKDTSFPDDVANYGRVSGTDRNADVSNYLTVSGDADVKIEKTSQNNRLEYRYTITGIKSGSEVTLHLRPMLLQRLPELYENNIEDIILKAR